MKIITIICLLFSCYAYASCDTGTVPDGVLNIEIKKTRYNYMVELTLPSKIELIHGKIINPTISIHDKNTNIQFDLALYQLGPSKKVGRIFIEQPNEIENLFAQIGDASLPYDSDCFVRSKLIPIKYNKLTGHPH